MRVIVPRGTIPGLRCAPSGLGEGAPRRALGRTRARCRVIPIHNVKQRSLLRSRGALLRPGFAFPLSIHPVRGERSAERRKSSVVARFGARRSTPSEARRASGGTRSPLGAPPWRFWAGGRASFSGISSGSVQQAPRSQVVMPGGRGPEPPGATVTSRDRRTPLPAPPSARLRKTAPQMSEDMRFVAYTRTVVNNIYIPR
jgi:hypothetical protein